MSYAEETTVSAERSRAEIETIVSRYAGRDTDFVSGRAAGMATIFFVAHGRRVKFTVPLPTSEEAEIKAKRKNAASWSTVTDTQKEAWLEQETRRRWRCLCLAIKAKFVAVESGSFTFEEEFLSHLVRPDGKTIYESIQAAVLNGQRLLPAAEADAKVVDIKAKAAQK
jgi:hypothetical protein